MNQNKHKYIKNLVIFIVLLIILLLTNSYSAQIVPIPPFPGAAEWEPGEILRDSQNNLHLIYVVDFQIYYTKSIDNGLTWSESENISNTTGGSRNPSLAIDSNDNLHVVWEHHSPDSYQILYSKYTTYWSEPVVICDIQEIIRAPKIVADSKDNLHVVFTIDSKLYYTKYTKSTNSWSEAENIWNVSQADSPLIAVDSNDTIHIIWKSPSKLYYTKYTTSWQEPQTINKDIEVTGKFSMVIDSNDNIHVVWSDWIHYGVTYEIYYTKYTTSWQDPRNITHSKNIPRSSFVSLGIDSNDYLHLLWITQSKVCVGYTCDYFDLLSYSKYTTSWSEPVTFHPHTFSSSPRMGYKVTSAGPDVVWKTPAIGVEGAAYYELTYLLYYNINESAPPSVDADCIPNPFSPDGDTVEDTTTFLITSTDTDGIKEWNLKIYSDKELTNLVKEFYGSGEPRYFGDSKYQWDGRDNQGNWLPNGTYYYVFSATDNNGNSNSTSILEVVINALPLKTSEEFLTIARDLIGNLHIVYSAYDKVYHTKSIDNGITWSDPYNISTPTTAGFYPSIRVDSKNNLHVIWDTCGEIYYSKYTTYWAEPQKISKTGVYSRNPSFVIDSNDNLHAVWLGKHENDDRHDIYYSKYTNYWSEPVKINRNIYYNIFPSIAIDSKDNLHMIWTEPDETGTNQIYYSKYTGYWSEPQNISNTINHSTQGILVIDSNDNLHVVWIVNLLYKFARWAFYYSTYTTSWSTPKEIIKVETAGVYGFSLAVDSNNNLYLVWSGTVGSVPKESDIEIFYSKYTNSLSSWSEPINLSNDWLTYDWWPKLFCKPGENSIDLAWIRFSFGTYDRSPLEIWYKNIEIHPPQVYADNNELISNGSKHCLFGYILDESPIAKLEVAVNNEQVYYKAEIDKKTNKWNYCFEESTDGEYKIYLRATDIYGNVEVPSKQVKVIVDNTKPKITSLTSSTHPDEEKWYNNTYPKFNWTASDNLSGIKGYYYLIDQLETTTNTEVKLNGTFTLTTHPSSLITLSGSIWYFHLIAEDNASNLSDVVTYKLKIDTISPQFGNFIETPSDLTQHTRGPLRIIVEVTDTGGSGLKDSIPKIKYKRGSYDEAYTDYQNMENISDNIWYFDIPEPDKTWNSINNQKVSYIIQCLDTAGNIAESEERSKLVGDVNDAPVLSKITDKIIDEEKLLQFTIQATDEDNDKLTYYVINLPEGAQFNPANHQFLWTPTYTQAGSYNVTFKVSDGKLEDSETITIIVNDTVYLKQPIDKSIDTEVISSNGVELKILANSITQRDTIIISKPDRIAFSPQREDLIATNNITNISFESAQTKIIAPIRITLKYTDADLQKAGGIPEYLKIFYYDENENRWRIVPSEQIIDKINRTISADITHLTTFRIFAMVEKKPQDVSQTDILGKPHNYPNPMKKIGSTTFRYYLMEDATVTIEIFTISGSKIASFITNGLANQWNEYYWDGRTNNGKYLPNGVYIYRITANGVSGKKSSKINKLLILR